jgi:FAD/FMN-containing dehydrogenase
MIPPTVLARIREAAGPGGWTDDPEEMAPHLVEWRELFRGRSPLLVRPADTAAVARVVSVCFETGTKIVPQGGNTSLCGGSVPDESGDEIVLSLARMNRIRSVDPLNDTLTAEAGCVLAEVQGAAAAQDRFFPLSLAAEGSCQIGGNLSTNAGGTAVLRYGTARDLVLGLEVVLPDGRVWDGLRGLRKDNTGYDLKQLFLGAEGTLGIITAVVLKLFARPRDVQTAFAAVRSVEAAVQLLSLARALSGGQVSAFELLGRTGLDYVLRHVERTADPLGARYDWYVLFEISGGRAPGALRDAMETVLAEGAQAGWVLDAVVAEARAHAEALWRLRESMSEAQKPEGRSIKHDISVPVSRVAELIERASAAVLEAVPGSRIVAFGHLGDGNIHFNPTQPPDMEPAEFLAQWERVSRLVHEIAVSLGGSISAEHGIGRLKRDELVRYKPAVEMDLMRAIKAALDPRGIMNPGKVL